MHGRAVASAPGPGADHAEVPGSGGVVALQAEGDGAAPPREAREARAEVAPAAVVLEEVPAAAVAKRAAPAGDGESGGDVKERGVGSAGDGGGEQREGARLGGGLGAEDAVPAVEVAGGDLGDGDPGVGPERGNLAAGQVGRGREVGAVVGVGEGGQGGIRRGGGGDQEQEQEGEDEQEVVARVSARWRHLGGGGEDAGSEISSPPPLAHLPVFVRGGRRGRRGRRGAAEGLTSRV